MSLYNQQKIIIRLCMESDLRQMFFTSTSVSDKLLFKSDLDMDKLDKNGILHQSEAIYLLLLNDIKTNLSRLDMKSDDFDSYYLKYINIFPYRLENKFDDYNRFLGFLLYSIPQNSKNEGVINNIRFEYSVFASTLKRERLFEFINLDFSKKGLYMVNPTLVLLKVISKGRSKFIAFYYADSETDISIVEINNNLYKFLDKSKKIMKSDFIINELKLNNKDYFKQIVDSGLLNLIG